MPVSGVSLPVTRPVGRALVVGNDACRADILRVLAPQGYDCTEAAEPFAAMVELSRQRLAYQTLILCLGSLFREELIFISTVKRRMPHVEIWLTQTEGRMAALAESIRLGADGLVAEDGTLHRMAAPSHEPPSPAPTEPVAMGGVDTVGDAVRVDAARVDAARVDAAGVDAGGEPIASASSYDPSADEPPIGEPVLTADELRALLQDQPSMPPSGSAEQ